MFAVSGMVLTVDGITEYLSKNNVQLGASYHTGKISNTKYQEGYEAAAQYINASPDEIGIPLFSSFCTEQATSPRKRLSHVLLSGSLLGGSIKVRRALSFP